TATTGDGLRLDVAPLLRDGAYLAASVTITNEGDSATTPDLRGEAGGPARYEDDTLGGFQLREPDGGLVRYVAQATDGDRYAGVAESVYELEPGASYRSVAYFPAPAADIDELTLIAGPFGELAGVPVQWAPDGPGAAAPAERSAGAAAPGPSGGRGGSAGEQLGGGEQDAQHAVAEQHADHRPGDHEQRCPRPGAARRDRGGGLRAAGLGRARGLRRGRRGPGLVEPLRHRADQQVGDEPHGEQPHHGEQRTMVGLLGEGARLALGVQEGVDDERPGDPRRRPGGEQPAVDRAHLVGAEQVAQIGGDGGETPAVEGQDHAGRGGEQQHRAAARGRHHHVQHRARAQVDQVDRLAADVVGGAGPDEPAAHVEQRQQADEPAGGGRGDRGGAAVPEEVLDQRAGLLQDADPRGHVGEQHRPQ